LDPVFFFLFWQQAGSQGFHRLDFIFLFSSLIATANAHSSQFMPNLNSRIQRESILKFGIVEYQQSSMPMSVKDDIHAVGKNVQILRLTT
jgi:hypothetical protein